MIGGHARAGRWLAGLVLALGGCERALSVLENKAQQVAQDLSTPTAVGAAHGRTLSEPERLDRKLTLYIECRARASDRIRDSWRRYDERIKDDGTPRKRGTQPFLYKIDSELTPCEDAARKGPLAEPALPLIEQAMADYLEHARRFATLSVQLDTYYETQGYAQDDWARGKQLAPEFSAAYAAWSEAEARLQQQVAARKDEVDRTLLSVLEGRKGKDLQWHTRNVVLRARALTRCVDAPQATAEGCEAIHADLQAARAAWAQHDQEHPGAADRVFWLSSFRGSSERYFEQSDATMPALRKGHATPEDRQRLAQAFDALAADAKNLRFE